MDTCDHSRIGLAGAKGNQYAHANPTTKRLGVVDGISERAVERHRKDDIYVMHGSDD